MRIKTFLFPVIAVFISTLIISCGSKDSKTSKTTKFNTQPISIKQFDTPPGADPSVSSEQGGNGFTGEGWLTNTSYNVLGDPKAIKGGQIIWSIPDFPSTIRIYGKDANSYYNRVAQEMIYENLLKKDPVNEEFIPRLATHWQISPDKMTFRFRINPNARWADGKPVIADDYIATFKLLSDPGLLTGTDEVLKDNLETPVAESKYIVSIKAKKEGWYPFETAATFFILPSHIIGNLSGKDYIEKYNFDVIPGSGPYYINKEDIDKQKSITMRRRNDYWGENERFSKGMYNFDIFRTDIVQDETLEFEKFKKGEIDIYAMGRAQWWAEKTDFDDVKRGLVQKRRIFNQNPGGLPGIALNMRKPPFDDIRIRKAFAMLFDRKKFNEKLFFNAYTPVKSYFAGTVYENPNNSLVNFNLDSAISLLEEAGWKEKNSEGYRMKNGKIFELELPFTVAGQERYLTIFQEDLKKAGIKLNLKQIDGTTSFKIGNERNFTAIIIPWSGQNPPDPEQSVLSRTADDPNSTNWPGVKNPRVDELVGLYSKTLDKKERIKQLREMDSILVAQQSYAFMWNAGYFRLLWHNKFGYPKWYTSRFDQWYGSADWGGGVFTMWWVDPERLAAYDEAVKDKAKQLPTVEVDEKFWLDVANRENKGETMTLNP
ncbi:MAG: extracellular solute-binding protein [bacterium]